MKKRFKCLNNKGFAFSTMLYGIFAVILVVLSLIFLLLKSINDESYYYSSKIEEELDDCILEEVALENCFVTSSSCDTRAYYACLGKVREEDGGMGDNPTFTLTYDNNGGSGCSTKTITYSREYGDLCTPVKNEYSFDGWYTELTGGTIVTKYTILRESEDKKIYARWILTPYLISYNLNGGQITGEVNSYNKETETFTLPTPVKDLCSFEGWTGSNGDVPQTVVTISQGSTGNKSYTANWICETP